MTRIVLLLGVVVLVIACKRSKETPATPAWPDRRTTCAPPSAPRADWAHRRSALVAGSGEAQHVAGDVILTAGSSATLRGKFAYGDLSKDLEDEPVHVFVSDGGMTNCQATRLVTKATDDDGRLEVTAPNLAPGFRHFWMVAGGDNTYASGGIWVLPHATPAVLFDVDGTLTTDDGELFDDLLGRGTAAAFDGAAKVVQRWADKGYLIIYVTGRPYPLRAHTRRWLEAGGFPYGPLFTPDRMREGLPTRDGVGEFKREALLALQGNGVTIVRAYGNAATDVCAYAQAKIDPAITYIIGNRGGCDGAAAPHALAGYVDHLADVEAQPTITPE